MISNLFVCEVASGKKVNKELSFSSSELKAAGITSVGEVEATFHVYNTDTWDTFYDTDIVSIKTSAYDPSAFVPNDSGKELFNDGVIRIVGKYVDEDSIWGTAIPRMFRQALPPAWPGWRQVPACPSWTIPPPSRRKWTAAI